MEKEIFFDLNLEEEEIDDDVILRVVEDGAIAREIEAACDAIGPSGSLSIVAHSNGGLVGRWALGELLEPATEARGLLERWRPQLFLTLASPHLGVFPFGLFWSERLVRRVVRVRRVLRVLAAARSSSVSSET